MPPLWGQTGASPSIPPAPNDATSPPNSPNDPPRSHCVTRPQRPQQSRPKAPPHCPQRPQRAPPNYTASPAPNDPNKPAHRRHVTAPTTPTAPACHATSPAPARNDTDATSPARTICRMVGRMGTEQPRGGDNAGGACAAGTTVIRRSPRFSTMTRREGAPMVPPIPTPSSWLVPAACTTRRREFHTPPRLFSFLRPPEGSLPAAKRQREYHTLPRVTSFHVPEGFPSPVQTTRQREYHTLPAFFFFYAPKGFPPTL